MHAILVYGLAVLSYASKWLACLSLWAIGNAQRSWNKASLYRNIARHRARVYAERNALATLLLHQRVLARRPKVYIKERQPARMSSSVEKRKFGPTIVSEPFFDSEDTLSKFLPGCLIGLHGKSGSESRDGQQMARELAMLVADLPVRLICPTAPNGVKGPSWRSSPSVQKPKTNSSLEQTLAVFRGLDMDNESVAHVHNLIEKRRAVGDPAENIVIAGHSQGGCLAVRAALSYSEPLGGCVLFAGFLGNISSLKIHPANQHLKVLVLHDERDDVVPIGLADELVADLRRQGIDVDFRPHLCVNASLHHSLPNTSSPAAADFSEFLGARFRQAWQLRFTSRSLFSELWQKRIESAAFSRDDEMYAGSVSDLACLLELSGAEEGCKEAESKRLEAIDIYKRIVGEKHPNYAAALNNYASFFFERGEYLKHARYRYVPSRLCYEAAERLYSEAMAVIKITLGKDHPKYATAVKNLARVYYKRGAYQKAAPLYSELAAIAIAKKDSREHIAYLEKLADVSLGMHNYEKTVRICLVWLRIAAYTFGEQDPRCIKALKCLALSYRRMRHFKQANVWYVISVIIAKRSSVSVRYGASLADLANFFVETGISRTDAILRCIALMKSI